ANATSYARTNTQFRDAGNYSVIVSNIAGSVTSSPALLSVNAARGQFGGVRLLANGTLQLNFTFSPGTNYVLESTTNWTNWAALSVLSNLSGASQFNDLALTNSDRFYRLRVGP